MGHFWANAAGVAKRTTSVTSATVSLHKDFKLTPPENIDDREPTEIRQTTSVLERNR
jgi:hypothetical protein